MLICAWKKYDNNSQQAFKKLFVSNSLDGSQDFLVSNMICSLVGKSMREIPKHLAGAKEPELLKRVVRSLIAPKCIRRNNIEGMELLENEGLLELNAEQK